MNNESNVGDKWIRFKKIEFGMVFDVVGSRQRNFNIMLFCERLATASAQITFAADGPQPRVSSVKINFKFFYDKFVVSA